jgi:glucose-6-phosphate isomerase
MMHFMIETILAGRLLGIDPFDQPAVELAKVLSRERLVR